MKPLTRILFGFALLSLALTGAVAAGENVTLEGQFVWARDDGDIPGDLTAVMTPSGENEWSVAFHFVWEEEDHTYKGTAMGSLDSGELKGNAVSDGDREMNFRFTGTVEEGTFNGTHGFVNDDGEVRDGGTLTLTRK